MRTRELLLFTTNAVVDREIVEVLGLVQGASSEQTLDSACSLALEQMKNKALAQGANAVVGIRYSSVGRDSQVEVLAYGTAVVLI